MRVFTRKGYKATGISDVAADLGLSHGALYTYVDSKEALFYLALLCAADPASVDELTIPVPTPAQPPLVALAEHFGGLAQPYPTLTAALVRRTRPVAEEFGAIIDEMYALVEARQTMLALVESSARELPELADTYFVGIRRRVFAQLGDYLRRRIRSGHLRPVPDIPTAARFIVETIAWFAWHRHGDPDSLMLNDDDCRRTVRHLLLAAFLPASSVENSPGPSESCSLEEEP